MKRPEDWPNRNRCKHPMFDLEPSKDGMGGFFMVTYPKTGAHLRILATRGLKWEHVSVSLPKRCPNWHEMCFVKSLFWEPSECVIQYHPAVAEYVNHHPYCLHLWKPMRKRFPIPPAHLVGPKGEV